VARDLMVWAATGGRPSRLGGSVAPAPRHAPV